MLFLKRFGHFVFLCLWWQISILLDYKLGQNYIFGGFLRFSEAFLVEVLCPSGISKGWGDRENNDETRKRIVVLLLSVKKFKAGFVKKRPTLICIMSLCSWWWWSQISDDMRNLVRSSPTWIKGLISSPPNFLDTNFVRNSEIAGI